MLVNILFIFLFFAFNSFAKEAVSTFSFLNTELMPKGVITFGYNSSYAQSMSNRFNSNGSKISSRKFTGRRLDFSDLTDSMNNSIDRAIARSAFKAYGIGLESFAGAVESQINVNSKAQTYVIGYGLRKNENLFLILPFVEMDFSITSSFSASRQYNDLIKSLEESGQRSKAEKLRRMKENPLKENLVDNSLSLPRRISTLSNIYLNYRKKVKKTLWDSYLIVPAGYKAKNKDFIDFKINERSFGFKQGLGRNFTFGSSDIDLYGSYHLRLPFKSTYKIPLSYSNPFSYDLEEDVEIKYGDELQLNAQYSYSFPYSISSYLGLQYIHSFKDSYKGKSFGQNRYELLEKETESKSVNLKFGLTFNSISAFLAKKFLLPLDINLQASKNIMGKNSFVNDWVSLNLLVFYK